MLRTCKLINTMKSESEIISNLIESRRHVRRGSLSDLFGFQIPNAKKFTCPDGLELSIQASSTHYCWPRENEGPWGQVEIGFPSEEVEEFLPYKDRPDDDPTDTVYGYVPSYVVLKVLEEHGCVFNRETGELLDTRDGPPAAPITLE